MKKNLFKIALLGLVTAAFVALPTLSRAEDKPAVAAPEQTAPAPKKNGLPFKGKVVSVDATASTLTVASLTLNVSDATKISKDGKKAKLTDLKEGETVSGYYKKDDAGKLNATTIRVGQKGAKKKAAEPAK
jgi:Cu/Ag efflux protein CusF